MGRRLRGIESSISVTVDGELQVGWQKVNDWTATPRTDHIEKSYIGEQEADLDLIHHGFDISFSVDKNNNDIENFINLYIEREQGFLPHPKVTITAIDNHDSSEASTAYAYYDCILKVDDVSVTAREEYVTATFTGKAKRRVTIPL